MVGELLRNIYFQTGNIKVCKIMFWFMDTSKWNMVLEKKNLLKQGVTGASSSSETLGQKDLRYFSDQPPYCGFIWPLLCPQKRQIRGLLPLVRITMMVERYQWLGLLMTLRGVRRKCSQRRKMGWGLRQVSGEISWSPEIFGLCPGKGEFELLNAQPLWSFKIWISHAFDEPPWWLRW